MCPVTVGLPDFHRHWLNVNFNRTRGADATMEAMQAVRECFPGNSQAVQREIVTAVFSKLTLKDRRLFASLKKPFSFARESEVSARLDEEAFVDQVLQNQVA